jgi:hypothetical protein
VSSLTSEVERPVVSREAPVKTKQTMEQIRRSYSRGVVKDMVIPSVAKARQRRFKNVAVRTVLGHRAIEQGGSLSACNLAPNAESLDTGYGLVDG